MGILKGIVQFTGSFNSLSFYELNGRIVVRKTGGFNGEAIKTQDNYLRTRENASQFGHCSKAGKVLRRALFPYLNTIRVPYLHNRVVSLLTGIVKCDVVSERGNKKVAVGLGTDAGKILMNGFNFNKNVSLASVVPMDYEIELGEGRFVIPDFDVKQVIFPTGATHISLQFMLLRFDFDALDYQLKTSAPYVVAKGSTVSPCVLTAELVAGTGSLLGLVFVEFFQEVNGEPYGLEGCALQVVGIV